MILHVTELASAGGWADATGTAVIDRLASAGFFFCERPDCNAMGDRDDLIQLESDELRCSEHVTEEAER